MFFIGVSVVGVLLAVALVTLAIKLLIKPEWFLGWLRGTGGLLLVGIAIVFIIFAWDFRTYKSMTKEHDIATISFTRTGPQHYVANLTVTGQQPRHFEMYGDLWQVDARMVRWKSWIEKMGVSPGYRLDRLSTRYFDIEDENTKHVSKHELFDSSMQLMDIWKMSSESPALVPFIEARYGSGTYLPMRDQALFSVRLTNTGLMARPMNDAAKTAINAW